MAKLPKWPKAPKKSASLSTWERYEARVKAVAEKRKKLKEAPKRKDSIQEKVRKIKG